MSAKVSILVWSVYAFILGIGLLLVPESTVGLVGIHPVGELVWLRILGAVAVDLGILYYFGWRADLRWFYQATVFGRAVVVVSVGVIAIASGPLNLLVFSLIEAIGVIWTQSALGMTWPRATAPTRQPPSEAEGR